MTSLADRRSGAQAQDRALGPLAAQRLPILMYHEITREPRLSGRLAVSPEQFAAQLGYLRDNGFSALNAARAAELLRAGSASWPEHQVVLTFDDGFADFYDTVLPLLLSNGLTATLFVTTGWVQDGCPVATDRAGRSPEATLSWSQIARIAAEGIEIAAHTEHHPQLDQLPPAALARELTGCKRVLEDRIGRAVTGLAYPFGYSNRRVRRAAAEAGYGYACAVANRVAGAADDPYALPRLTIGQRTTLPLFARTVGTGRLPAEYLGYRVLTKGWAAVRRTRTALRRGTRG